MTIELSSTPSLFADFSAAEKRMLAIAVLRVEELEETRRITAGMASQAGDIQRELEARGITDADVMREAREAVEATAAAQAGLASEVHDYRKLFGADGRAVAAIGQYVTTLRVAHAGDVNALNRVQAARRELYEARAAAAVAHAEANEVEGQPPTRRRRVQVELSQSEQLATASPETAVIRQSLLTALPASFADRYVRDGSRLVEASNAQHVLMIDHGTRLQLPREYDDIAVKAAVDIAEAREWSSMRVNGTPKFRQAVWAEAASRGIAVAGYTPSASEQEWAERVVDRAGRLNKVQPNEAVAAFQDAATPEARREAAKQFPQLRKAFAIEASYSKLASRLDGEPAQKAFMARMREHIADDLAHGRELAEVRLRRNFAQESTRNRVREAEQDRVR